MVLGVAAAPSVEVDLLAASAVSAVTVTTSEEAALATEEAGVPVLALPA